MAGYLGNIPTAVPLSSADLADGIITTAKIADGTILNADINASAGIVGTKLGAGTVLQVVSATDATQRSTTSTSFVTASNTMSVSITPSSASNKILIIGHTTMTNNTANKFTYLTVFRNSTNLISGGTDALVNFYSVSALDYNSNGFSFLDSPSTTSATTYQVYLKVDTGSTGYVNASSSTGAITVLEIKG